MRVELAKWGNSVAVRVPAGALADAGMRLGQAVEIRADAGRLVLEPAAEDLDELVSRITDENRHAGIWDEFTATGAEAW